MEGTRSLLSAITVPFYWVADIPGKVTEWGQENFVTRSTLLEDNQRLRSEALLLKGQVQKLAALRAENVRLRALLNSSALLEEDVLVAELIGISPDPARHLVVVDKGTADGVFVGQPLIDANGLDETLRDLRARLQSQ